MRKLLLVLSILFTSLAAAQVEYNNFEIVDGNKRYEIILGFWNNSYPAVTGEDGYIFQPDGRFIYFIYYGDQLNGYSMITVGAWKEKDFQLWLQPQHQISNESGEFIVSKVDEPWSYVSDLRSYNYYWFPNQETHAIPPAISIRYFEQGKLTPFVRNHMKFFDYKTTRKKFPSVFEVVESRLGQKRK